MTLGEYSETRKRDSITSGLLGEQHWNATVQSVPTDLRNTVQSVATYIETVKAALGDNKLGKSELQAISVAGANAVAGLQQFAGAQGQTLANAINTMTQQFARGKVPKAKSSLGALEQSARSLPSVPQPPRK